MAQALNLVKPGGGLGHYPTQNSSSSMALCWPCLPRQGYIAVFRFIIEYSSLRDFGP